MHYPHRLTIKRTLGPAGQPSGVQDDEGNWDGDGNALPRSLFDRAKCDVQELSLGLTRRQDGQQAENANVICYVEDESKVGLVKIADVCVVEWEDGTTSDGEVKEIRRLDGALILRFLR